MSFGRCTYKGNNFRILWESQDAKLIVDNFTSIADNVTIFLGGNHPLTWITQYPFGYLHNDIYQRDKSGDSSILNTKGNVVIGSDVWIGAGVTIMSGITIGDGARIATNSHVVKNVKPYETIGGNPGRSIGFRFTEDQIEELLKIKWWEWDDSRIKENVYLLCGSDINNFIEKNRITD